MFTKILKYYNLKNYLYSNPEPTEDLFTDCAVMVVGRDLLVNNFEEKVVLIIGIAWEVPRLIIGHRSPRVMLVKFSS